MQHENNELKSQEICPKNRELTCQITWEQMEADNIPGHPT